jgi:FlaG/FlaF family flagellin (archaellin)
VGTPVGSGLQFTVPEGARIICEITNTRIPPPPGTGAITVTKSVQGTTADWTFGFTLNGSDERFATNASPTVVWSNLPAGSYTLREVLPPAGWQAGAFACKVNGVDRPDANPATPGFDIVLQPGDSVTCAIVNTKLPETGAISVTKSVTGTTDNWFFVFTLNGGRPLTVTNTDRTATWTGLQPGASYTLAEVNPGSGWAAGVFACTVDGAGVGDADPATPGFQIIVQAGQTVACAITNTKLPPPPPASITLTKVITLTKENDWSFAFELAKLPAGQPQVRSVSKAAPTTVWNDLDAGTYLLSEIVPPAPFVEGNFVCTLDGRPVGEAQLNGPVTLLVNPGDKIICIKYNVDLSGTDLLVGEEPTLQGKALFLPMVNR